MQRTKKQEVRKSHLLFSGNKLVALCCNSCRLDLPFRQASKELIAVIQSGLYKRCVTIRSEHGQETPSLVRLSKSAVPV